MTLKEDMIDIFWFPTENTVTIRGPSPGMDMITGRQTALKKLPGKDLDLEWELTVPDDFG
jgi:hypothetical protein